MLGKAAYRHQIKIILHLRAKLPAGAAPIVENNMHVDIAIRGFRIEET